MKTKQKQQTSRPVLCSKSFHKVIWMLIFVFLSLQNANSQIDTVFWLAAP
ncbi:MAG: hypothetical protein LBR36_01970 [Bacteroidales bacterium]|nr:hypothetical protein [Bacteroidales bacterium]